MQIVTSPPKKNIYKVSFFACFWSARQQLSFGQHTGGGVVSSIDLSPRAQAMFNSLYESLSDRHV